MKMVMMGFELELLFFGGMVRLFVGLRVERQLSACSRGYCDSSGKQLSGKLQQEILGFRE